MTILTPTPQEQINRIKELLSAMIDQKLTSKSYSLRTPDYYILFNDKGDILEYSGILPFDLNHFTKSMKEVISQISICEVLYWNGVIRTNEMVDLYKYGLSTNDISLLYNLTRERVRQILKSVIVLRPRGGPNFKGKGKK